MFTVLVCFQILREKTHLGNNRFSKTNPFKSCSCTVKHNGPCRLTFSRPWPQLQNRCFPIPKLLPATPDPLPLTPDPLPLTPEPPPLTPEPLPLTPEPLPLTPELLPLTPEPLPPSFLPHLPFTLHRAPGKAPRERSLMALQMPVSRPLLSLFSPSVALGTLSPPISLILAMFSFTRPANVWQHPAPLWDSSRSLSVALGSHLPLPFDS